MNDFKKIQKFKIDIAKDCGFCSGVNLAIEKAKEAAKKYGKIAMLNNIVHNEKVVKNLSKIGIIVVNSIDEIVDMPVLLQAHGTETKIMEELKKRKIKIIDATCPLVKHIHTVVKELEDENRKIIIIGDHEHDEVKAIASQVKKCNVVSSVSEAKNISNAKKIGIVSQSTQMLSNYQNIVKALSLKSDDMQAVNTICKPSRKNQNEVVRIAKQNDIVLIIGSFTSANTKRLYKISKKINSKSYQIQSWEDVDPAWLKDVDTIGITAGASTPNELILEVKNNIEKYN